MLRIQKEDILSFHIDYLEVFCTLKDYKEFAEWLDSDNSNYRILWDYTIEKMDRVQNYSFKLTFWRDQLPCFAWYLGKKINTFMHTRDYFIAYWSAFLVMEIEEILQFLQEHFICDGVERISSHALPTIKRFDLALDIAYPIKDILLEFPKSKQKGSDIYGEDGETQTRYIWEVQNRKNKWLLIRIYNKIVDIHEKGKQKLYTDYLLHDHVTRIELEFRRDLSVWLPLLDVLDKQKLFDLYVLYLKKHSKICDELKLSTWDTKKLRRSRKKVDLEELRYNQVVRKRYTNAFLGYAKKFLSLGSCPVDVLIRRNVYDPQTVQDILISWWNNEEKVRNREIIFSHEKYQRGVTKRNMTHLFADNGEFGNIDNGIEDDLDWRL